MDGNTLYNLQEAYLGIYQDQELDEGREGRRFEYNQIHGRPPIDPITSQSASTRETLGGGTYIKGKQRLPKSKRKYDRQVLSGVRAASEQEKARARKRMGIDVKEQVDIYDIILSHLLDGGYAETPEAAEVIMVNMSEEWRYSIIDESRGEDLRAKYGDNPSATLDKRAFSAAIRGKTGTQRRKTLLGLSGRASIRSRGEMPQGDQEIRSRGGARRTFGSDENRDRGTKEERFAAFAQGKRNSPNITDTERRFRHGR